MSLPLRALFIRRSSEPSMITVAFEQEVIPVQLKRNAGPNLGYTTDTLGEAYMRLYPQVTGELA